MTHTPRGRILIVDDDEDIVQIISTFLTSRGYACTTAYTGAQGLIEFQFGKIDLILTDMNMPAGDGIALINRIRRGGDIPIIILTAFSKEYSAYTKTLEDISVLRKPFEPQALLDLIEVELSGRQAA